MRLFRRRLFIEEIKGAARLQVEPGDTIVLSTNDDLDIDEVKAVKQSAEDALPGVRCLVMTSGLSLRAVLREGGRGREAA